MPAYEEPPVLRGGSFLPGNQKENSQFLLFFSSPLCYNTSQWFSMPIRGKLTKGVLSYTLRGDKAEIELIYISCLGKKDTIRVLEIPSHINGKEVDYIHKRLIYNFEHYFPSLKTVELHIENVDTEV